MPYPLVSVIIPTYCRPLTLRCAIISALAQESVAVEVLVCEDGNSEVIRQIVADFQDIRVRHIAGVHVGRPAIPRNRGIAAAHGQWLAFLDDDDSWLPNKLWKQLNFAERMQVRAVCSNAMRMSEAAIETGLYFMYGEIPPVLDLGVLLQCNRIICSSACFHRSLLLSIAGFPEDAVLTACEDFALWLRIACFTKFAYIDEALVCYADTPATSIRSLETNNAHQRAVASFVRWCWQTRGMRCFLLVIIWARVRAIGRFCARCFLPKKFRRWSWG